MINKLLITCLQRNKRLVLPTLGAFIRKNIDGVGVVLVFVPFLHKDDGVLHSAIKSWASVEDDEATQILTEYISAIKKSLDERGKYNIEGIGVLKYDINNIVALAKEDEIQSVQTKEVTQEIKQEEPTPTPAAPTFAPNIEPIATQQAAPTIQAATEPLAPIVTPQPMQTEQPINFAPSQERPYTPQAEPPTSSYARETNQPLSQKPTDMGTRYFSPERDQQSLIDSKIDKFSQHGSNNSSSEPTQQYPSYQQGANTSSRADISSTFNRQRPQSRISDLYESRGGNQVDQSQNRGRVKDLRSTQQGVKQPQKRRKITKKRKNNDIVLIIAVAAIILTIVVLIYGYMHGGEQTLESLDVYDPIEIIDSSSDTI